MNIPIIIVAAGASRRLGRPKQLEIIDGVSLLNKTIYSALNSELGDVIVVLGADRERIITHLNNLNKCKVVYNSNWEDGMGTSIAVGIQNSKIDDKKAVIISVCDQPFISSDVFKQIGSTFDGNSDRIIISQYFNGYGPPTLFGKDYFEQLKELKGDEGGKSILKNNRDKVIHSLFENGHLDIDDQRDLDQLKF